MTNPYKIRRFAVGTVKKSSETNSDTWLSSNVCQVWEGELRCRIMYLALVGMTGPQVIANNFNATGITTRKGPG